MGERAAQYDLYSKLLVALTVQMMGIPGPDPTPGQLSTAARLAADLARRGTGVAKQNGFLFELPDETPAGGAL